MRLIFRFIKLSFVLAGILWAIPWTILGLGIIAISGPIGFLVGLAVMGIGGIPLGAMLGASLMNRAGRQHSVPVHALSRGEFDEIYSKSGDEIDFFLVEWEE